MRVRIDDDRRPLRTSSRHRSAEGRLGRPQQTGAAAFEAHLAVAGERLQRASMDVLLQNVTNAGLELLRHRGERQLQAYKAAVREFMEAALEQTYEVAREERFNRYGQRVLSVLVRRIDEKLEALTIAVLSEDTGAAMRLAARLDEIRGLLLDFYR